MRPMLRRMAAPALALFKYYVEHGQAYQGKAVELPRAHVTCY